MQSSWTDTHDEHTCDTCANLISHIHNARKIGNYAEATYYRDSLKGHEVAMIGPTPPPVPQAPRAPARGPQPPLPTPPDPLERFS